MYYRVTFRVGHDAAAPTRSLDVVAEDQAGAEAHATYVAVDPERKRLAMDKYGDRRLQIAHPELVQPEELPPVTIVKTIELVKVNRVLVPKES